MTSATQLAELLKASRGALLFAAFDVTPERAMLRPADGEWSVIEVLAHLADTDHHYARQAVAMRDHPNHLFVHLNDEVWKAEHPAVRERPFEDILTTLAKSHEAVLQHLASMTDGDLDSLGLHPRGIPYTVRHVFLRLPEHDENHTRQIEEILAAI